jgi:hypothetical protein
MSWFKLLEVEPEKGKITKVSPDGKKFTIQTSPGQKIELDTDKDTGIDVSTSMGQTSINLNKKKGPNVGKKLKPGQQVKVHEDKFDGYKHHRLEELESHLQTIKQDVDLLSKIDSRGTGAGDLHDQIVTMDKGVKLLQDVLERAKKIVPADAYISAFKNSPDAYIPKEESVKEGVNDVDKIHRLTDELYRELVDFNNEEYDENVEDLVGHLAEFKARLEGDTGSFSEGKAPFRISYSDKYGKHAGFEDGTSLQDIQDKAQKLRAKGFKIDKMGRNTAPVKEAGGNIEGYLNTIDEYVEMLFKSEEIKGIDKNEIAYRIQNAVDDIRTRELGLKPSLIRAKYNKQIESVKKKDL